MTIPPEVRVVWNLRNGDSMRFTVEEDVIVAQCVSPRCVFCNRQKDPFIISVG